MDVLFSQDGGFGKDQRKVVIVHDQALYHRLRFCAPRYSPARYSRPLPRDRPRSSKKTDAKASPSLVLFTPLRPALFLRPAHIGQPASRYLARPAAALSLKKKS